MASPRQHVCPAWPKGKGVLSGERITRGTVTVQCAVKLSHACGVKAVVGHAEE